MNGEKDIQYVGIADAVFIKINFHRFGVACITSTHLGISGLLGVACGIAAFDGHDTLKR